MSKPLYSCMYCGWEGSEVDRRGGFRRCPRCDSQAIEAIPCVPRVSVRLVDSASVAPLAESHEAVESEPWVYCRRCDWSGRNNGVSCPKCGARTPGAQEPTELGSVRGDGESSCTIRNGSMMFVGTLPNGLWRLYLERVE